MRFALRDGAADVALRLSSLSCFSVAASRLRSFARSSSVNSRTLRVARSPRRPSGCRAPAGLRLRPRREVYGARKAALGLTAASRLAASPCLGRPPDGGVLPVELSLSGLLVAADWSTVVGDVPPAPPELAAFLTGVLDDPVPRVPMPPLDSVASTHPSSCSTSRVSACCELDAVVLDAAADAAATRAACLESDGMSSPGLSGCPADARRLA